jgi:predicted ATPase/transcriptional regulator with XRE-family HTH domain
MNNTDQPFLFGAWLKLRRKVLDLTQAELAQRAGCSVSALRKIESDKRRPSKQLAALLAKSLEIPSEDQTTFVRVARGELNLERLSSLYPTSEFVNGRAQKPIPLPRNLPVMPTPLIGREQELMAIRQLLNDPQCRLLTLFGPGGIGKTHLAIEVASQNQDLFPDGVCFVPLAPIGSPLFLESTIADALGFVFQSPVEPRRQLLNYLREKKALIVLDNVEHLLDGVGLFSLILENSAGTKLLVTSRERMNLLSEWVFEIHGLPVPPNFQVENFYQFSSVKLFLQIAGRTLVGYKLGDGERQWVYRICQSMEGMPLGIELAATWVSLLSCEEIAREIERSLDFPKGLIRDLPERHSSLRATLDHSWKLLKPEEKATLRRLSVFPGNFDRKSAQEICGASLITLSSLIDKSLLRRIDRERYDLHELIQHYSASRLAEDPEEEKELKGRHAIYFARLLQDWEKALKSSKQKEALSEMADEIDNLRQGWEQMVTCYEGDCAHHQLLDSRLFQSSLFSLSLFYEMRCRNWEAVNLFEKAVDSMRAARDAVEGLEEKRGIETALGQIMAYLGLHHGYILQFQQARELLKGALRLLENDQAKLEKARAQNMLALIIRIQGEVQKSIDLLEEARTIFREQDDRWWYVLTLIHLAWAYLSVGKVQEGKTLYQEGFQLTDPGNLRLRVPIRNGLAYTSYLERDFIKAERLLQDNQEKSFELGNKRQTALCYLDLGQVALATNRVEAAEMNLNQCIDLICEFGGSHDLALALVYLGKCLASRMEIEAARSKFIQAIQIGQELQIFHLVYFGLVNLARLYMLEGQIEKACEMSHVLRGYSVEYKVYRDDGIRLENELKHAQSRQQSDVEIDQSGENSIESLLEKVQAIISLPL